MKHKIFGALHKDSNNISPTWTKNRLLPKLSRAVFLLLAVLFCISCGSKAPSKTSSETPAQPEQSIRSFAPAGIQIQFTADKMLNLYDNEPHTVILAIYQLSNVNAFNNLTKDPEGLTKLLSVQSFDASVTGMDKIIVQPGETKSIALNRAENASWIGIVAGYYSLVSGQVNRLFSIPLITRKTGIFGFRKTESRVGQMTIKLILGPTALQEREVIVE